MTTLAQLAELVGGAVIGPGDVAIHGAAPLDDAGRGQITLLDRAERAARLHATQASAAVVPLDYVAADMPAIAVANVHQAFRLILTHFRPQRAASRQGVSPHAHIAPSARLADDVEIHAGASIGADCEIASGATIHSGVRVLDGCRIAAGATLMPNVVLYEDTTIGARAVLHANVVIGAFGFGYEVVAGKHVRGSQLGWVEIEADVEIGAGTTIDRGTYGPTIIGEGTKIDNLVQIGHNCHIGKHNIICGQVGIAGSVTSGDYVVMAGQVGIRDHVKIGDRAILSAKSGISCDIPAGSVVLGSPATPLRHQKIQLAAISKLPEMRHEFKLVKRAIEALTGCPLADARPAEKSNAAA